MYSTVHTNIEPIFLIIKPTRCTTFFYHQLDAQTSCLFTYNTLIKILYVFRVYPAHLQEVQVVIVYMQSLVSSLFAGDCLVHRCTRQSLAHLQEVYVVIVYMQSLVSSLSADDCLVYRCTRQSPAESDDTRDCIQTITTQTS